MYKKKQNKEYYSPFLDEAMFLNEASESNQYEEEDYYNEEMEEDNYELSFDENEYDNDEVEQEDIEEYYGEEMEMEEDVQEYENDMYHLDNEMEEDSETYEDYAFEDFYLNEYGDKKKQENEFNYSISEEIEEDNGESFEDYEEDYLEADELFQYQSSRKDYRDLPDNLIHDKIKESRVENLMILYFDYFRTQKYTPTWYVNNTKGVRTIAIQYFTKKRIKKYLNLIEKYIKIKIGKITSSSGKSAKWKIRVIFWLYYYFPEKELYSPPPIKALNEIRQMIKSEASKFFIRPNVTLWTAVYNRKQLIDTVGNKLSKNLHNASVKVYNEHYRHMAMTPDFKDIVELNWQNWLYTYVKTISDLGKRRKVSNPLKKYPKGNVHGIHVIINLAVEDWKKLTHNEQQIIKNKRFWDKYLLPKIWKQLQKELVWGFAQDGKKINIETFDGRRWRFPGQRFQ